MQIVEHQQLDDHLFSAWQRLWDVSPFAHFFNHPSWFLACQQVFPSDTYRIITVSDENGLAAVLPVCRERKFGIKTLTCPGGRHLDKSTLLLRNKHPHILSMLFDFLTAKTNFYLSEANADIANLAKEHGKTIAVREASVNPYIPLLGDPFFYLSRKQQKKILKLAKKLEGRLKYCRFEGDIQGLKDAITIDRESQKNKEGRGAFAGKTDIRFLEKLIRNFKKQVVVDILYLDSKPFVFSAGFLYKNVFHAHISAYDSSYHSLSPRKLLLHYTLPCLREEGVEVFDFSRGTSSLKGEFTPLCRTQFDIYYAKNILVKFWWKMANRIYHAILNSKIFYRTYLVFKRSVLNHTK